MQKKGVGGRTGSRNPRSRILFEVSSTLPVRKRSKRMLSLGVSGPSGVGCGRVRGYVRRYVGEHGTDLVDLGGGGERWVERGRVGGVPCLG